MLHSDTTTHEEPSYHDHTTERLSVSRRDRTGDYAPDVAPRRGHGSRHLRGDSRLAAGRVYDRDDGDDAPGHQGYAPPERHTLSRLHLHAARDQRRLDYQGYAGTHD